MRSVAILLAQFGINENVKYEPIFSAGKGKTAGIIAATGMVVGNMILTYTLTRWLYASARRRGFRNMGMFSYLLTVASIGNMWDYVPIRTFGNAGDIHTVVTGFQSSPWMAVVVLGIPTALAMLYFFRVIEPCSLLWLFPGAKTKRGLLNVVTALGIFGFYGAAGWVEDVGPESRWLSRISVCVLFPLAIIYGFRRMRKVKVLTG